MKGRKRSKGSHLLAAWRDSPLYGEDKSGRESPSQGLNLLRVRLEKSTKDTEKHLVEKTVARLSRPERKKQKSFTG